MDLQHRQQAKEARKLRKHYLDRRRNRRNMPYSNPVRDTSNPRRFSVPPNALGHEEGRVSSVVTQNINQHHSNDENEEVGPTRKFNNVWDFGDPSKTCPYCGAILWYEERTLKSRDTNDPKFSICCQEGFVRLPLLQDSPPYLKDLLDYSDNSDSKTFRENIRSYNSIFAFTSMGGKIDRKINNGRGPYVFRINGQNHHKIGSLLPENGSEPKFAQLYIYDTENEVSNRRKAIGAGGDRINLDEGLIRELIRMFDQNNELAKVFRMARDRFKETDYVPVRLKLIANRQKDARQYNLPTSSEVAALIVGNGHEGDAHRDIIIEEKGLGLRRINQLHPSFMALQYPILFPYGEDGYRINILGSDIQRRKQRKRKRISIREYYAFRIQQRRQEGQTLVRSGRLYQQFLVDAYASIEEERLSWVRRNQPRLRSDLYSGLKDAVVAGDTSSTSVGRRLVLPSSFTGGPRFIVQNYQDAIAICRWAGPPSLFITFTCNPKWIEIQRFVNLIPRQPTVDRTDISTRVFKIKLDSLMGDLRKGNHFGRVTATVYTIEFQKRGLPHAHILLFLHPDDKPTTPAHIDKIISAELPDKDKDPLAYESVQQFMVHGPCGNLNWDSPCMKDKNCSKHYPKDYCNQTNIDDNGFPVYRRRKNSRTAKKGRHEVDNGWIIPHNRDLIVKYQAHINVEVCNQSRAVKYLFKYIHKGSDRATFVIEENTSPTGMNGEEIIREVDEVKNYLDCRYISASESCWRILEFETQYRSPAVQRLAFHLEDEQPVVFKDTDDLEDVLNRDDLENTKFLEWMKTNQAYPDARELTYVDFPTKWVWKTDKKIWERRKSGKAVGRIYYALPTSGERFYLRMLLNMVRGPCSFKDIRTVNGVEHPTFKSACFAYGLLEDDNEWHEAVQEAGHWSSGQSLREMFVTLLLFCEVTDPLELWNKQWELLSDDIERRQRRILQDESLKLNEEQLKNYALFEIEKIMNRNKNSLKNFPILPFPDMSFSVVIENRLIREELNYEHDALNDDFLGLFDGLNTEQKLIFDAITNSGGFFFVYGSGGTGKTYLWNTVISNLRSKGRIVLAVASSGIASLLLPGGRTAHSRFKIPLDPDENSCCNISQQTHLAELIRRADLIVWDEAPMNHRNVFEAVDRSLRDILRSTVEDSEEKIFGGKTIVLGGDFRQTLPVVPNGSREEIVGSSISKSPLWKHCQVFVLTINMRLRNENMDDDTIEAMSQFSQWILQLGNGSLPAISVVEGEEPTWIKIPDEFLIPPGENSMQEIVNATYPDLVQHFNDQNYLKDRCILVPTNECVDEVNSTVLATIPGEVHTFFSADSLSKMTDAIPNQDVLYPVEFLNSLKFSGIPSHELRLKVGVPIMLLRNLNQGLGLCNGTRLIVTRLAKTVIQAEIITGSNVGTRVLIPRIIMSSTGTKWPFTLRRRQFPVKICFAMTINKSQGQTLKHVGIYLPKPVFSHGQLYVAVSRTSSRDGLKILIEKKNNEPDGYTQNIVYREVFNDLPSGIQLP